ncbi:MAG: PAC2 family protein [Candidatus Korarchaeum sp.]
MGWTKLVELSKPSGAETAIIGFPGVANVGEQVITYLVREKKATPVMRIYSEYLIFPNNMVGISVTEDGRFLLPSVSVFQLNDPPLVLVTSDVQPVPWGSMEVANEILKALSRLGVRRVIVITGFVEESVAGKVLVFGTDSELLDAFLSANAVKEDLIKVVVGLAGSVLGLARIRGISSIVVSGVSPDYSPDPRAAKRVLQSLDAVFSLNLDFESIDRQIEEIDKIKSEIIREIERRIREEQGFQGEGSESTEYVG